MLYIPTPVIIVRKQYCKINFIFLYKVSFCELNHPIIIDKVGNTPAFLKIVSHSTSLFN